MNKNIDDNLAKTVREDLLIFKNETLKEIKLSEKSLLEKYRNTEFSISEKIQNFEKQIKQFSDKIIEILAFIDSIKDAKNSIDTLLAYKIKSENSIFDLDLKLKSLDKDCHDSIYNISNILKDSVIYPGIIGSTAKFKNFHDLVDFILSYIAKSKQFNEKIQKDVNTNRIRQDNNIEKIKASYDDIASKTKALIVNEIISIEEKNNSFFRLYDEKFQNIRVDNEKYGIAVKNTEQLLNNFKAQMNDIENTKNELLVKFNDINEKSKQHNKEITTIKEKYHSLANYIKNMKFVKRENSQNDIKNDKNNDKENLLSILNNNDEISSSNKELIKIKLKKNESGLKAYISGKISINQLQSLQNRNNFKSIESFKKINNNYEQEENITPYESKKLKTSPVFKENDKLIMERLENKNIKRNIIATNYNSSNNTKNSKQINDLKINKNLVEKSSDTTLNSNQNANRVKPLSQLRNISLNVEGNKIFNIKPKEDKNSQFKNIIDNVKKILENSENKKNNTINGSNYTLNLKNNNYPPGFPKIVTNQGERIIISSHPVFHRHKFIKNENQNVQMLNKTIQKLYSKENKAIPQKKQNNNYRPISRDKFFETNNLPIYLKDNNDKTIANERTEAKSYNHKNLITGKNKTNNESFDYNLKNNSYTNINENRYYDLMMNSNKKKVYNEKNNV